MEKGKGVFSAHSNIDLYAMWIYTQCGYSNMGLLPYEITTTLRGTLS